MTILVTGATGTQGGAVARALLARGQSVRALVRDPNSAAAKEVQAWGATLAPGSFENLSSLRDAMTGIRAVFSVQLAPSADPNSERREANALVAAAREAGVEHFIHSSVSNTGSFRSMVGWAEERWARNYWESKADAEAIAADAGFPHLTLLRPAFMMENFAEPKAAWMFPDLAAGEIVTAIEPETRIALIAADDIAIAVADAIAEPHRFSGEPLELAGDWLTMSEVAEILSRVAGRPIVARTASPEILLSRGQGPGWIETQEWMNIVGYPARPEMMAVWGLSPTSFARWARTSGGER